MCLINVSRMIFMKTLGAVAWVIHWDRIDDATEDELFSLVVLIQSRWMQANSLQVHKTILLVMGKTKWYIVTLLTISVGWLDGMMVKTIRAEFELFWIINAKFCVVSLSQIIIWYKPFRLYTILSTICKLKIIFLL